MPVFGNKSKLIGACSRLTGCKAFQSPFISTFVSYLLECAYLVNYQILHIATQATSVQQMLNELHRKLNGTKYNSIQEIPKTKHSLADRETNTHSQCYQHCTSIGTPMDCFENLLMVTMTETCKYGCLGACTMKSPWMIAPAVFMKPAE